MTVEELIKRLQKYEGDEKVRIARNEDNEQDVKDVWRKWNEPEDEDYKTIIISNF